jgi:hypothetical protein
MWLVVKVAAEGGKLMTGKRALVASEMDDWFSLCALSQTSGTLANL